MMNLEVKACSFMKAEEEIHDMNSIARSPSHSAVCHGAHGDGVRRFLLYRHEAFLSSLHFITGNRHWNEVCEIMVVIDFFENLENFVYLYGAWNFNLHSRSSLRYLFGSSMKSNVTGK